MTSTYTKVKVIRDMELEIESSEQKIYELRDTIRNLISENGHRAEVIDKRDGTIKQLQKRNNKLEAKLLAVTNYMRGAHVPESTNIMEHYNVGLIKRAIEIASNFVPD